MPRFSIVIPTRNRANLLQYALQSALEQTYRDYEVIVSDNHSSDETWEVVQRLGSETVRYVRTPTPLTMSDSWDFGIQHASGDYVTVLCDDDAIAPHLLERVAAVLDDQPSRVVAWHRAWYLPDSSFFLGRANTLLVFQFSGKAYTVDSKTELERLFSFSETVPPRLLNSACHRDLIERVRGHLGKFCLPPVPDYSSCAAVLGIEDTYTIISEPLSLGGGTKESIGAAQLYNRGNAALLFAREFGSHPSLPHVPLRSLLAVNYVASALLGVRFAMPEYFRQIDMDWERYFCSCYEGLLSWWSHEVDITEDLLHFHQALAQQPPHVQQAVRVFMTSQPITLAASGRRVVRRVVRKAATWWPVLAQVAALVDRGPDRFSGAKLIRGQHADFTTILECARKLQELAAPMRSICTGN